MIERIPPLELTTPESAEIDVDFSVIVLEGAGVDRERTADGLLHRLERAFGLVGHGHAQTEHAVVALCREDEIVLAVFLHDIVVPHLFLCPGHVFHVENHAVVGGIVVLHVVPRQHVVVFHLEVSAVVVEAFAGIPVVAGVDIEAVVEHVGRWVGHIVTWE